MTDTHCHLNHKRFATDLAPVLQRAHEAGVCRIVNVGFDLQSSAAGFALADGRSIWCTVGVHPHDAATFDQNVEAELRAMATDARVVAIGEIGLDYHYDFSPRAVQREVFARQLVLAQCVGIPVVVHCREAYEDVLRLLSGWGGSARGVMHCWSGSVKDAERAVDLGFYLGIGGVLTFKKRGDLESVIRTVPKDRLVLETDAPYLTPVPHRGKRNEPSYLPFIAGAAAEILGISAEEVSTLTDRNAGQLFPRMRPAHP